MRTGGAELQATTTMRRRMQNLASTGGSNTKFFVFHGSYIDEHRLSPSGVPAYHGVGLFFFTHQEVAAPSSFTRIADTLPVIKARSRLGWQDSKDGTRGAINKDRRSRLRQEFLSVGPCRYRKK